LARCSETDTERSAFGRWRGPPLMYRRSAFPWRKMDSKTIRSAAVRVVVPVHTALANPVNADMPLMQAGVNSVSAVHLSSHLRALTGVELSPTIVFDQPTPRAIARHLTEAKSSSLCKAEDVVKVISEQLEATALLEQPEATPISSGQSQLFSLPVEMGLPMSICMQRDCQLGAFHMLQTYQLEPNDDIKLINRALERVVSLHPMLRSIMKPPLFYIKEKADFELDHVDLPSFDISLCSGLTACTIDLSKSVFRARIYTVDGCAAFLALSIHHVSYEDSE
jgi:hypothetical protein